MKGNGEVGGVPGLAAARLWAATRFPYLATGLFGAHVIAASGTGTVAVDAHDLTQAHGSAVPHLP